MLGYFSEVHAGKSLFAGFPYVTYMGCFLLGVLITLVITPLVIRLSVRLHAIDKPAHRKIHAHPVPLLGGLAIFIGVWAPLLLLCFYDNEVTRRLRLEWFNLALIFVSGLLMILVGIIDDLYGLNAKRKFLAQLPVAILLFWLGTRFTSITIPFMGTVSLGYLSPLLTILWMIGVTNALNLIDGIDGLATGVAFFVAATNAVIAVEHGNDLLAVVMGSMAGACLGFLRYNFSPAKIFLGDTGSLFLGMTLAVSSISANAKGTVASSLLIPLLVMGYPVLDTLLSMMRRLARGKSMFSGDAGHIHHRLLQKGLGHRWASGIIYAVCCLFSLLALAVVLENNRIIALSFVMLALVLFFGLHSLGYFKYFTSPKLMEERKYFQIAYHYAAMMKCKIALAENAGGVLRYLEASAAEYQIPMVIVTSGKQAGRMVAVRRWRSLENAHVDFNEETAKKDVYFDRLTGLHIEVFFNCGCEQDEMMMEKRSQFADLVASAFRRMSELGHAPAPLPPRVDEALTAPIRAGDNNTRR
jgi:UDP-GlcNAc:undecaprenyl-phosphate/decaprenyl-phosphate GlcNAc-1-phosphate transferase